MQIFPIHLLIALALLGYIMWSWIKGEKDIATRICIALMPTYAVAIFFIPSITYAFKFPEFLAIIFIAEVFLIQREMNFRAFLLFMAFIFALIFSFAYLSVDFPKITVWEIEASNRVGWSFTSERNSLSRTNLTQTFYLLLSLLTFLAAASAKISREKVIKSLEFSIYLCFGIGVLQLLSYYSNQYQIYLDVFYNSLAWNDKVRLPYQMFQGIKRVNAGMGEASNLGFFLTLSMATIFLLRDGARKLTLPQILGVITAIASTSLSAWVGMVVLAVMTTLYGKRWLMICVGSFFAVLIALLFVVNIGSIAEFMGDRLASGEERLYFGITHPMENFLKSPLFGVGYGSDRALILPMNMLVAFGILGCVIISVGFLLQKPNPRWGFYLMLWFIMGFSVPDLVFIYIWLFLGLMLNKNMFEDDEQFHIQTNT